MSTVPADNGPDNRGQTARDATRSAPLDLLVDSYIDAHGDTPFDRSTQRGVERIYLRFIVLAVGLNALLGVGLIAFDVFDSLGNTRSYLNETAERLGAICRKLQQSDPTRQLSAIVGDAATLTAAPMALLDQSGGIVYASSPYIASMMPRVYEEPNPAGLRIRIDDDLGDLSGAWLVTAFGDQHKLVVIATHSPEDEGLLQYMTIGAGVLGLGLAASFLIMLTTARRMLHRPLRLLVYRLTSALARDVQRRRRVEQEAIAARLEAEQHLAFRNDLIEASDRVGIVATDREGVIRIYNRTAERLLGYPTEDVVGHLHLGQLRGWLSRAAQDELPLRSLMEHLKDEQFISDKRGRELIVSINSSHIVDGDGQHLGELLTFGDVTPRRRLEAELKVNELQLIQSAKMASLGEMATGVAHELNQPLNNIGLLASRLGRRLSGLPDTDREFCRERIDRIQGQVQRASRIIDQLRSFGRRSDRSLDGVDLTAPVRHVTDMLAEQFEQRQIRLEVSLANDLPVARADGAQLEQVLLNLLLNARDAFDEQQRDSDQSRTAPCWLRIVASRCELSNGDPGVQISVADNGPGMPAEVSERVFQPFFTTKEPGKGTGLGLSISYSLVSGFEGTLEVDSTPGSGTTFHITLPAAKAGNDENE